MPTQLSNDSGMGRGRLVSIDVLRGLAILWVLLYHLWSDFQIIPWTNSVYYRAFWQRAIHLDPWAFTAFTDIVFRVGYQGVPLFMMLSGFALTRSAMLKPVPPDPVKFVVQRARKVLPPYWFGFVYTMLVIASVALVLSLLHGGGFAYQIQSGVTFGRGVHVPMDWGMFLAGATMLPRVYNEKWMYAPEAVLWFVPLLLQYYLLFPFLYRALRRAGPAPFVVATVVWTIAFQAIAIRLWGAYSAPQLYGWILAPFRLSEFSIGMAVGYLFVARPTLLREATLGAPAIVACVGGGLILQTYGSWLDLSNQYLYSVSSTAVVAGLSLMALPLLTGFPARFGRHIAVRPVALAGAASYAVLIVNEPFRYVMSLMRHELPGVVWWPVLILFYIPASVFLAQPVAAFFGLTGSRGVAPVTDEPATVEQPAATSAVTGAGSRAEQGDDLAARPQGRVEWVHVLFGAAVVIHVVMFCSLFYGYLNPLFDNSTTQLQGVDFFSIYQAGTRAVHGQGIYTWPAANSVPYAAPYRYLPFFAFTGAAAFNLLPAVSGYWLWVDLIEVMVAANVWLTFRITPDRNWRWVAAALWLVFTPLYLEEYMGQWSFLMATLMLWTAVALERGRAGLSATSWGLSVLIKSNSALLGPIYLRMRQWRVLFGLGAALVLLNLPYFVLRPGDGRYFWDFNFAPFFGSASSRLNLVNSGDLSAVSLIRTAWLSLDGGAARVPPTVEHGFIAAIIVLSFCATLLPRRLDVVALFAVWSCSFFLVYFSWEHHYVMLLPALVLLVALRPQYRLVALFAFVCVALPTPFAIFQHYYATPQPEGYGITSPQWQWPAWAAVIDHVTKPVPVLILWSVLVCEPLWQYVRGWSYLVRHQQLEEPALLGGVD